MVKVHGKELKEVALVGVIAITEDHFSIKLTSIMTKFSLNV
jgi:hypothetical protein